jgi:iron complex transport system substrate-binding protein
VKRSSIGILLVVSVLLAACGEGDGAESTTSSTDATTTSTTNAETTTTSEAPEELGATFTGADGVESDTSDTSRVVSLNGDLTEILFELGLGGNVVAVDVTTVFPEEAAALGERGDTVGFAQQLTAEAVLRFEPTLVIGDQQVGPAEAIEQLRDAGIPVVILDTQTTLDGVATKIGQVAEVMGVPDEGTALADRVSGEIEAARELVDQYADPLTVGFVYARGPQTIFLFGAGMATQAMIEGAGAIDAGAASGVQGLVPVTAEALVAAAPQVIVLPELGLEALGGVEAFLEIPGVSDTPAGQNETFLVYDEAYFFNLGPRTGAALAEFIEDLQALGE